jgi:hypothetical protein
MNNHISVIGATDFSAPLHLRKYCEETLFNNARCPIYIIPIKDRARCLKTMYAQLLEAISFVETEFVSIAEHDVLYASEHFMFHPARMDVFYYPAFLWRMCERGLYKSNAITLSGLICSKKLLENSIKERLASSARIKKSEFGNKNNIARIENRIGNIDIRHSKCYTGGLGNEMMRERNVFFENSIPEWGNTKTLHGIVFGESHD